MPSARVTGFSGIVPELAPQLLNTQFAVKAHDVYLKDGVLRPRYAYKRKTSVGAVPILSLLYDEATDTCFPEDTLFRAVTMPRPMMQGVVGLSTTPASPSAYGGGRPCDQLRIRTGIPLMDGANGIPLCMPAPTPLTCTVGSAGQSTVQERPVATAISVVAVRVDGARSVPALLAVAGLDYQLFSDGVQSLACTFDPAYLSTYAVETFEFYYSAYSLETGETPNSSDKASIMGFSAPAAASMDVFVTMSSNMTDYAMLSERNYSLPPAMTVVDVAATDDGHLVVGGYMPSGEGVICVSERYIWNAFPIATTNIVPEKVLTVSAGGGIGVVGTTSGLYQIRYEQGEEGARASIAKVARAPARSYACMSDLGGVVVSDEGVFVVGTGVVNATAPLLNTGDTLYEGVPFTEVDLLVWRDGILYGFGPEIGMELSLNSAAHSVRQFSNLTTFSSIADVLCVGVDKDGVHIGTGAGWFVLPYPDARRAPGLTAYNWKSKTFVLPQITTMAAFKAVGPCDGTLTVKIWCDQQLAAEFLCNTPDPCRIPAQYRGCEWAIELTGTRSVREVHLATSMPELSEGSQ